MTRRKMLFGAAATAGGGFLHFGFGSPVVLHGRERVVTEAEAAATGRKLWGRVTLDGWMGHKRRTGKVLRVFVRGEDVTRRCAMANDRAGKAILFLHDENGRCYLDTRGGPARELYRGPVTIVECDA